MSAVLFDLDETILDRTGSLIDFARWQAQGMLRSEIANEEFFVRRFIELDANGTVWKDEVYAALIDEFSIAEWAVDELLTSYELCFCGFCKPKPGVVEAIHGIKAMGKKVALVSNGKSPFQERNFGALGISHLFDAVVVSEAVGLRKPERAIFELACQLLDTEPSDAIFVGDNPIADIEGANNAGLYSIYIPGHYGDTYAHADKVCRDFRVLLEIVQAVQ